jgi:hypothetical protein
MRSLQWMLITAAAATAIVLSAGAALAHDFNGNAMTVALPDARAYSGSWPVTVSRSQHSNGTYCLTLAQNSGSGGSASVLIGSRRYLGSFLIVNHTLVTTITAQGYSQNAALMFIGSATRGDIGRGAFEDVYGGSDFDSGALAFGTKGASGCAWPR